jgi:hypothetical protein
VFTNNVHVNILLDLLNSGSLVGRNEVLLYEVLLNVSADEGEEGVRKTKGDNHRGNLGAGNGFTIEIMKITEKLSCG